MPRENPFVSYSGAEVKASAYYPGFGSRTYKLDTLHTINISVHEAKGQARAMGHRGIKGVTAGVATVAGSMIFQQLNVHPLKDLMDMYAAYVRARKGRIPSWSLDWYRNGVGTAFGGGETEFYNRLLTRLPPFNVALHHVPETGPFSGPLGRNRAGEYLSRNDPDFNFGSEEIEGVHFLTEAKTISVDDGLIQIAAEFVACNYKPFSVNQTGDSELNLVNDQWFGANDALFTALFGRK